MRRRRSSSGAVETADSRTSKSEEGPEEQDENSPAIEEETDDDDDDDVEGDANRAANTRCREPLTTLKTASRDVGAASATATAPAVDSSISARPRSAPAAESVDGSPSSPVVHARSRSDASGEGEAVKHLCSSHHSAGLLLEDIELVNLHNLSLHRLEGMERLVFVRVADLSGNELHDTAPLRSCVCLEVCCVLEAQACALPRTGNNTFPCLVWRRASRILC